MNQNIERVVLIGLSLLFATAGLAGCSNGTADGAKSTSGNKTEPDKSAAPTPAKSHTFAGTGTKIEGFRQDDELVTFAGKYDVHWDIKNNKNAESSGSTSDGVFELSLFCEAKAQSTNDDLDQIKIVREVGSEVSGDKNISIANGVKCQVNVVATDTGKWEVKVAQR